MKGKVYKSEVLLIRIPHHKNHDFSRTRKYFCTKFCPFVKYMIFHHSSGPCRIYFMYAKTTHMQTSRTNFAIEQVEFIKLIELQLGCDVSVMSYAMSVRCHSLLFTFVLKYFVTVAIAAGS